MIMSIIRNHTLQINRDLIENLCLGGNLIFIMMSLISIIYIIIITINIKIYIPIRFL